MTEIDLTNVLVEIALKLNQKRVGTAPHVHVSIPSHLPKVQWHDNSLGELLHGFLSHVLQLDMNSGSTHIAIHTRAKMSDLEAFFGISPPSWIQFSVVSQGSVGFEEGARQILKALGYRCDGWIGVEGSQVQLSVYCLDTAPEVRLILSVRNRKARKKCEILIPIAQLASQATDETKQLAIA
jgi:hypothetical protein